MGQGATVGQLARGLHGAVTREDAKRLAKLHGVKWKALFKAMKRLPPRPGRSQLDDIIAQAARGG